MTNGTESGAARQKGVLGWIERTGNALPDPVFIFFWLMLLLVIVSIIAATAGVQVLHPVQRDEAGNPVVVAAASILSP
jgi:aminobenzoyl-glutamate transport protein